MSKFKHYKHSYTNTSESLEIARIMEDLVEKSLASDGFLSRQKNEIAEYRSNIELLQGRSSENSYTEIVFGIDSERDDINTGIEIEVRGKMKLKKYDHVKGEAAEKVNTVLEATPVSISAGYTEESNQLNTRIRQLNTPENRAHFETLTYLHIFDKLVEVQKQFEKVSSEKDALESIKLRGTVREQVEKMHVRINYALSYLDAQFLDLPAEYEQPVNELSASIQRIMTIANSRRSKKLSESNN